MTRIVWELACFSTQTDQLLAEVELDDIAAARVESLLGENPGVLTEEQVPTVAALFGIDPERWGEVVESATYAELTGHDWLSAAMEHVAKEVLYPAVDVYEGDFPISADAARGLLRRFGSDIELPTGDIFLSAATTDA